jgi:hypothetical protein
MKITWKTWAVVAMAGMIPLGCDSLVDAFTPDAPAPKDCKSASEGDSCAVVGDGCSEGDLGCGATFVNCGQDHLWHISTEGGEFCPEKGSCPSAQPTEGGFCDPGSTRPWCPYLGPCGNTIATCEGVGSWHLEGGCPPPPPPLPPPSPCPMNSAQAPCETDPDCRWLTPGCGPSPLSAAGCFPIAPCDPAGCQPGMTCQTMSFNPCFEKACGACNDYAYVCAPSQP